MKWTIEYCGEFSDAREAAERILELCDESYFDDMLDECYGDVEICGMHYCASIALYRLDPVAYRCARSDWEDAEASDIEWQLERMSDGEIDSFYGIEVEATEDDEDEDEDEEGKEE